MFKLFKSKTGFTLVELMIVVVIMAILVAVAVPIYSAVTSNARKKTCNANRRTIVESLTTLQMQPEIKFESGTITLTTNADGNGFETIDVGTVLNNENDFLNLFQTNSAPCCPGAGNTVTITVTKLDDSYKIVTNCDEHEPKE